jgi:hypothetical protein
MMSIDECLEAFAMRTCCDTQNEVIKESFRPCGLTFVITKRGGFIYDKPHLESLRVQCQGRSVQRVMSVYHVIGCGVDMGRRMSVGAKAIEKHMLAAIVSHYPGVNSLIACAMKHCRTIFLY